MLAVLSEQLINQFFQWRYDTALVFVRVTKDVALTCVAIAVPLGASATVVASWALLRRGGLRLAQTMNAIGFAWRSLVRQPARAALGILGVAAVGALLFDMLLLSRGLIVSMQDLLDRGGWDVRVSAGDLPAAVCACRTRWRQRRRSRRCRPCRRRSSCGAATAQIDRRVGPRRSARRFRVSTTRSADPAGSRLRAPWTILRGRDAERPDEVVDRRTDRVRVHGSNRAARSRCARRASPISKRCRPTRLTVVGIAEFPFQTTNESTTGGTLDALKAACGGNVGDDADLILVTSTGDADGTAAAIRALRPELRAATNSEVVGRLQQTGFTYFRQISSVLTTVTVSFAVLLITVLLTVSVNQRLGEIAALRALGFSRMRVVKDVLVGIGADRRHRRPAVAAARAAAGVRPGPDPQGHAGHSGRAAFLRVRDSRRSPSMSRCSWRRRSSRRSTRCASCRRCRSPRRCETR